MEVSSSVNTSQSLALAAYGAQLGQETSRARERERQPESAENNQAQAAAPKRADRVSFSNEAMRLSAQSSQSQNGGNTRQASESTPYAPTQDQNAINPAIQRAEAAKSIAQAINAYRSTSVI